LIFSRISSKNINVDMIVQNVSRKGHSFKSKYRNALIKPIKDTIKNLCSQIEVLEGEL